MGANVIYFVRRSRTKYIGRFGPAEPDGFELRVEEQGILWVDIDDVFIISNAGTSINYTGTLEKPCWYKAKLSFNKTNYFTKPVNHCISYYNVAKQLSIIITIAFEVYKCYIVIVK